MGLVGKTLLLVVLLLAVYIGYKVRNGEVDSPAPVLARDVWWGRGERQPEDVSIKQFKIQVPEDVITDLNARLDRFLKKPITPPLENVGFQYGFNTNYLRTLVQYWKDKYVWREREKLLNQLPQFVTTVNGLKLHYIRVSPAAEGKRVLPLLLLHGWPGSVREFYEFIPEITKPNADQDFVFDVIAPSLPGFGFSEGSAKPGMGPAEIAVIMNNLMNRIGFKKYYVQGGDWGSFITKAIGQLYPNVVPLNVPSACARFHYDISWTPTAQLKFQYINLVQVTDYTYAGHFPALEVPKVLAQDIISAVQKFESIRKIPK